MNALTLRHAHTVPAILANAGENAATKFLEFFAARIRNLNTREAYARACAQFSAYRAADVAVRSLPDDPPARACCRHIRSGMLPFVPRDRDYCLS
jgi:hypothetical protein